MNKFLFALLPVTICAQTFATQTVNLDDSNQEETIETTEIEATQLETTKLDTIYIQDTDNLTQQDESTTELFNLPGSSSDPLIAIQALPGIQTQNTLMQSPSVRGSAPEDNQFYINGVEIDYIFHKMGYSIFSDNLIRTFDIHYAASPANFTLGTGGQFDIYLKEAKQQPFETIVDLGMFRSGVFINGAINDHSNILAEFRRSTISYFGPLLNKQLDKETFPASNDLTVFYNNQLNSNNKISAHFIAYNDIIEETPEEHVQIIIDEETNEQTEHSYTSNFYDHLYSFNQSLNWIHSINNNQKFNNSISYVSTTQIFDKGSNINFTQNKLTLNSSYLLNSENFQFEMGTHLRFNNNHYIEEAHDENFNLSEVDELNKKINNQTHDIYSELNWYINDFFTLSTGANFVHDNYLNQNKIQPRISLDYLNYADTQFFISYGKHYQKPQPEDYFTDISKQDLKFIEADHFSAGFSQSFNNFWQFSSEIYYKEMKNIIGYELIEFDYSTLEDGDEFVYVEDIKEYDNNTIGSAYGVELMLKKEKTNKASGWLALSLSHSERTDLNTLETTPYFLDIPIAIDAVFSYQINDKLNAGTRLDLRGGQLYRPLIQQQNGPENYSWVQSDEYSKRFGLTYNLNFRIDYDTKFKNRDTQFYLDIITQQNKDSQVDYSTGEVKYKIILLPLIGMKMHF